MVCVVRRIFTAYCCFFFVKQKTAYEMRISDWSSDVCSSDLALVAAEAAARQVARRYQARARRAAGHGDGVRRRGVVVVDDEFAAGEGRCCRRCRGDLRLGTGGGQAVPRGFEEGIHRAQGALLRGTTLRGPAGGLGVVGTQLLDALEVFR